MSFGEALEPQSNAVEPHAEVSGQIPLVPKKFGIYPETPMPFQFSVLMPDPELRTSIITILDAALNAVDPYRAVQAVLQLEGHRLVIGEQRYDLDHFRHIYVIGAGKAGAPHQGHRT